MIPKIVHHLWPGNDPLREPYAEWRKSWAAHHPDWTLLFWRTEPVIESRDMAAILEWIFRPDRFSVVVRSDALRWLVLLQHGGVYADTDMESLRSLEPLLDCPEGFFCAPEPIGGILSPALMGCRKGHPFARDMMGKILERLAGAAPEVVNANPHQVTGPYLMTQVADGRSDIQRLPPYFFCPSPKELDVGYARHHFMGSNDPKGWRNRGASHNFGSG